MNLEKFIPCVTFLGETLGENYEIVLHDLSRPERSIIAIVHGELSGRSLGGPVTDLTLKILKRFKKEKKTYFSNYHGKNMNGNVFLCSSYFIVDENGQAAAVLCINHNITPFLKAKELMEKAGDFLDRTIIKGSPEIPGGGLSDCEEKSERISAAESSLQATLNVFENFHGTVDDVIDTMIENILQNYSVPVARLSGKERRAIVHELNENGLFLLKGGITALAVRLDVSEPTIYRHLQQAKREKDK